MSSNLPSLVKLTAESVPGAPDWFLTYMKNQNLINEGFYNVLNKNANFDGNLNSQFFSTSFTFATGVQPVVTLNPSRDNYPLGVVVVSYSREDNGVTDTAISCRFTWEPSSLKIYPSLNSFVNAVKYRMTFLIIFG